MNQNIVKKNKVIAVVGPTASGKTAHAVHLAKQVDGEIISADSRLVYKGLNIAAAKPTEIEMDGIKHHMIDIVEPEVEYSAGTFAKEAKIIIDDIISRGKTPIVVGGTGLYFRILLENYDLPKVEPDSQLRVELSEMSGEDLHKMLYELDPDSARNINVNDKKKLIRTIEIVKIAGKPLSEARGLKEESEYEVEWIGLNHIRRTLYDRINRRVDSMMKNGLIDETKALLEKHGRIKNIVETIGYKEMISFIDGNSSYKDAVAALKQNTRRYAKRQLTWFRKNNEIKWNNYPDKLGMK